MPLPRNFMNFSSQNGVNGKKNKTLVKILGGRDPCNPCGVDAYAERSAGAACQLSIDHCCRLRRSAWLQKQDQNYNITSVVATADLRPVFIRCRRHIVGPHVDASCFRNVPIRSLHPSSIRCLLRPFRYCPAGFFRGLPGFRLRLLKFQFEAWFRGDTEAAGTSSVGVEYNNLGQVVHSHACLCHQAV